MQNEKRRLRRLAREKGEHLILDFPLLMRVFITIKASNGRYVKVRIKDRKEGPRKFKTLTNKIIRLVNRDTDLTENTGYVKVRPFGAKDDGSEDVFLKNIGPLGRGIDFNKKSYLLVTGKPKNKNEAKLV